MNFNPKILRIRGINGIYDELYRPIPLNLRKEIKIEDGQLDLGRNFWSFILSETALEKLLHIVDLNNNEEIEPEFLFAINDRKKFINNVKQSVLYICDQGNTEQEFYAYLETIAIVCEMYNKFIFGDELLNISDGLITDETSSKKLYNICTSPKENPAFLWILENIIPIIIQYNPDIIFLDGRPNLSFFTIGKILKNMGVKCHICSTYNASEYYSLSKIKNFLVNNDFFFKVFDSAILDNFDFTELELIAAIKKGISLDHISNIIYNDGTKIWCTDIFQNKNNIINFKPRIFNNENGFKVSPKYIEDVHLIPYKKCYWNKCTFCGINKKYLFEDLENEELFVENLKALKKHVQQNNIKFVWFIDEAIPPKRLRQLAEFILENKLKIVWQARCRIEKELLSEELPTLLFKSGLKELRLGLESASLKVLKLMKKFPDDFSLKMVTDIVSAYHSAGISIHFPIIIGFPGETTRDRRITYDYLSFLRREYPTVTFNINILTLDVSSHLFNKWFTYNISKVELPCPNNEFIGNIAFFLDEQYTLLDRERDEFMREQLYPWYPKNSYISPHIYYRLSETIRNTLVWKYLNNNKTNNICVTSNYKFSDNITYYYSTDRKQVWMYNWNTHRYFKTNFDFAQLLISWKQPTTLKNMIMSSMSNPLKNLDYNNCRKIFDKLINFGFLLPINELVVKVENESYADTASYFDMMYSTNQYDYNIIQNNFIKDYIDIIPKGIVLEVGIGCGQNIDYFLEHGYTVHGLDISYEAISTLKNKYSQNKNCHFECQDVTRVKLSSNTYSLIVCSMSLHYINASDIEITLNKLKDALCDNGLLYISVLSTQDSLSLQDNSLVKHFFTREEIELYFSDMDMLEIQESLCKDTIRNLEQHYWGTIKGLFIKRKEEK